MAMVPSGIPSTTTTTFRKGHRVETLPLRPPRLAAFFVFVGRGEVASARQPFPFAPTAPATITWQAWFTATLGLSRCSTDA